MEIMRMRKEDILAYLLASLGCNCVENRSGAAALIADASGGEPATPEAHLLLGRAVKKLPGKNNVQLLNSFTTWMLYIMIHRTTTHLYCFYK